MLDQIMRGIQQGLQDSDPRYQAQQKQKQLADIASQDAAAFKAFYDMLPEGATDRDITRLMLQNPNQSISSLGRDNLGRLYSKSSSDSTPASIREYQYAKDQGFEGSLQDWKQANKTRMHPLQRLSVAESKSIRFKPEFGGGKVDAGTPWEDIAGKVETIASADQTTSGTTVDALDTGLKDMYSAIDNLGDDSGLANVARNIPGVGGEVVNAALNAAGLEPTKAEVDFNTANKRIAGAIVKMMSGAAATDVEREFWERIQPRETDSPKVKKWKYNSMIDFADKLSERAREGGVTGIPDFQSFKRFEDAEPEWMEGDGPVPGVFWES